jgi:hypothetical protein
MEMIKLKLIIGQAHEKTVDATNSSIFLLNAIARNTIHTSSRNTIQKRHSKV